MAVVNGEAYGHGLEECALALKDAGAVNFGVLDAAEGVRLKKISPGLNIHILAGLETREQIKAALDHDLILVVYSLPQLQAVEDLVPDGQKARVFLKIDTGMGRLGLPWFEVPAIAPSLARKTKIAFLGFMTHLATVGDREGAVQLERFQNLKQLDQNLGLTQARHSALAGPGLLAHPDYEDEFSRVGLLLYGGNPLAEEPQRISEKGQKLLKKLKPVMTLASQIIQIRTLRAGETVSYDRTFTAQTALKTAAVPIGYVHGLLRSRSNRGYALIAGKPAPLLGRVCMNLSLYDVSQIPQARPGQRVVLLGRDGRSQITAQKAALWQETSAYEIFCLFGRLNYRHYQDGL
jgi:alanine racemase